MTLHRLFLTEDVASAMRSAAAMAYPLETGGILVGVMRDGEPWVTSAIELADARKTTSSFVIPFGVTPTSVDLARRRDARVGYLGDWHCHPANVGASSIDRATLGRNAKRSTRSEELPTILIVLRRAEHVWEIEALADAGNGPSPIELLLTGSLPPSIDASKQEC